MFFPTPCLLRLQHLYQQDDICDIDNTVRGAEIAVCEFQCPGRLQSQCKAYRNCQVTGIQLLVWYAIRRHIPVSQEWPAARVERICSIGDLQAVIQQVTITVGQCCAATECLLALCIPVCISINPLGVINDQHHSTVAIDKAIAIGINAGGIGPEYIDLVGIGQSVTVRVGTVRIIAIDQGVTVVVCTVTAVVFHTRLGGRTGSRITVDIAAGDGLRTLAELVATTRQDTRTCPAEKTGAGIDAAVIADIDTTTDCIDNLTVVEATAELFGCRAALLAGAVRRTGGAVLAVTAFAQTVATQGRH